MRQWMQSLLMSLLLNVTGVVWGLERNGFDLSDSLAPVAEIHSGGPAKDGIPALDHPAFIAADQAHFSPPTIGSWACPATASRKPIR